MTVVRSPPTRSASAIEAVHRLTHPKAPLLAFGPPVCRDADLSCATLGIAHDAGIDDKGAASPASGCSSSQRSRTRFTASYRTSNVYEGLLVPQELTFDKQATLDAVRLDHMFAGAEQLSVGRVSVLEPPLDMADKSDRTLVVYPVARVDRREVRTQYGRVDRSTTSRRTGSARARS
jgi:hypothetical protein